MVIFFKILKKLLFCVWVFSLYVCLCTMFMLVPMETEEGTGSPRADVVYNCEPSCRSWVLQEEQAFNHWAIFAAQEYFLTKKRLWDKLFYSNFQRKSETIGHLIDFLHNLEFSSWMCVLR